MKTAIHAEWTKLRTEPATPWLLLAVIATTIGIGVMATNAGAGMVDPTKIGLTGTQLGQAVVAILAVLAIGNEYSTGMIRISLTAMPRRTIALSAKAIVLTGVVLATAAVSVLGSLVVAGVDPIQRVTLGSIVYLGLIGLLSLGIAVIVRSSAAAIGIVLGLLYLFPIVSQAVSDPAWQRRLLQIGPMTAGLNAQTTVSVDTLPLSPWAGIGVVALWASGAMLVATLLLRQRDA